MIMKSGKFHVLAIAALLTVACGASDRGAVPAPARAAAEPAEASIGHVDERLGAPSFVWLNRTGATPKPASAVEAARFAEGTLAKIYRLDARAAATLSEPEIHDVGAGPILARVRQRIDGVDVFRGGVTIAMSRAFAFFPVRGRVMPAWYTEFMRQSGEAWSIVVSAKDGAVLFANDLVRNDFTYRVYADAKTKLPMDGPEGNGFVPHPTATVGGVKKLAFVPSELVSLSSYPFSKSDPWLAPNATETNGNNVNAFADLGGGDGYQSGFDVRPAASSGSFDFTYDTSASPGASPSNVRASAPHVPLAAGVRTAGRPPRRRHGERELHRAGGHRADGDAPRAPRERRDAALAGVARRRDGHPVSRRLRRQRLPDVEAHAAPGRLCHARRDRARALAGAARAAAYARGVTRG